MTAVKNSIALVLFVVGLSCSRNGANERVARVPPRDADSQIPENAPPGDGAPATSHNASVDASSSRATSDGVEPSEARRAEIVPIDISDANTRTRRPAQDWDRQLRDGGSSAPTRDPRSSGRILVANHRALDQTTLSSNRVVTEFLRRNLGAVKQCYSKILAVEPQAHGAMKLRFAISETGGLVDGTAESWKAELSDCVREAMSKWTFPIPEANGSPARSRFELGLDLKSE